MAEEVKAEMKQQTANKMKEKVPGLGSLLLGAR